ncbi:hypothetical protein M5Y49_03575 [Escherichia coli]|nr:hypothetical protein [Escherichia coli]
MLRPTLTGNASFSLSTATSDKTSRNREQNSAAALAPQTTDSADSTVSLSQQAKEYYARLQNDAEAISRLDEFSAASRKADARARLEAIKREIERLKALLMRFGNASAYVLKQLRQLSAQMGQAASQLGQSDSTSTSTGNSTTAAYSAIQSLTESDAGSKAATPAGAQSSTGAPAEDESASDGSETEDSSHTTKAIYSGIREQLQERDSRHKDAQLLKDVERELRSLLSMVKSKMREDDKDDRDMKKDIEAVQQQLDMSAQQMTYPGIL